MENKNWRRIGYFTLMVITGLAGYGIGWSIGAMDSAKWFTEKAVDMGLVNGIGKAELLQYFIQLKGGAG